MAAAATPPPQPNQVNFLEAKIDVLEKQQQKGPPSHGHKLHLPTQKNLSLLQYHCKNVQKNKFKENHVHFSWHNAHLHTLQLTHSVKAIIALSRWALLHLGRLYSRSARIVVSFLGGGGIPLKNQETLK